VIPTFIKPYLILAAAAVMFTLGWTVNGAFNRAKIANLEASYANERTLAAEHAAAAQAQSRQVEKDWRARVDAAQEEAATAIKVRDARISAVNATNGKLQQRIAALAGSGGAAEDSPSAASHLRKRVDALGTLVGELDSFAGQVAATADTLREELSICRQYVRALGDNNSG
jgi:hypothetical protein